MQAGQCKYWIVDRFTNIDVAQVRRAAATVDDALALGTQIVQLTREGKIQGTGITPNSRMGGGDSHLLW